MDATQATDLAFGEWNMKQRDARVAEQEKLYHYFIGEHNRIISYLEDALSITFPEWQIKEFQKNYINITKKVIKSLCVVYSEPAKRYFKSEFGKKERPLSDKYNSYLPENINSKDKTINRYGKLFNTALTQCGFDPIIKKITYVNRSSHLYDVIWDEADIYKPIEVSYPAYLTIKGKLQRVKVVWTDKLHYILDSDGNQRAYGKNGSTENAYGIIPFVVYREEEQGDFWGNGQTDLVNGNEQVNFLMTDLINGGVLMQAWGTPVAINMKLSQKNTTGGVSLPESVKVGAKHALVRDGVTKDELQPSFHYESASPMIAEVLKVIVFQIKILCVMKGLDPNKIMGDLIESSGFSKIVDSLEQLELRKDSIEPCMSYENDRFKVTKAILNFHLPNNEIRNIPEDEFAVDFAEIKMPVDPETQIIEDNFLLTRNVISVRDIAKRRNPDLGDAEIEKLLKQNKEINDLYAPPEPVLNNTSNINLKNNGQTPKEMPMDMNK